ncbi:MAG: META domain-containing protein [Actinomycetota bacterium]
MVRTRSSLLASIITVAAVAAGCGSDEPASVSAPPTTSGPTPMDESTTTTAAVVATDRSTELAGRWVVLRYATPAGEVVDVLVESTAPSLEFGPDGSIVFHTGCNQGDTTFSTTGVHDRSAGQAITIEQGSIEEAECLGELGAQDLDLPRAWQRADRFVLDGARLSLTNDGAEVVVAVRDGA